MEWVIAIMALWVFIGFPILTGRRLKDQDTTINLLRRNDDTLREAINDSNRLSDTWSREITKRMDRIEAEIDRINKEIIREP